MIPLLMVLYGEVSLARKKDFLNKAKNKEGYYGYKVKYDSCICKQAVKY